MHEIKLIVIRKFSIYLWNIQICKIFEKYDASCQKLDQNFVLEHFLNQPIVNFGSS